ncbi:MAG: PqqD family peptide modification chaperone [Alphaproteobacteria bacterium]|nr:PqqD family peptide modification chaperone [Alphaproteobacteria bacterium]
MPQAYYVNETSTIHEIIDGEAIMINLDSGNYYTLNDCGAFVWELIRQKRAVSDMARVVASQFRQPQADVETQVGSFIQRLAEEGLILKIDGAAQDNIPPAPSAKNDAPYAPPEVTVFSDMQELLLLDPIHEVGEQGWPHTSPKSVKSA